MVSRITGRDRLRYVITKLPQTTRAEIKLSVQQGGDLIVQTQRRLAPVDTGDLRDSIVATPGDRNPPRYAALRSKRPFPDPELAVIISAGNSKVRYAHLVEFGTAPHVNEGTRPGTANPGTPPRPYFYPGFRARKKEVQNKINRAARAGIKKGIR